jgi:hypothetical protein
LRLDRHSEDNAMSMKCHPVLFATALAALSTLVAGSAFATEETVFESCVDGRGNTLPAVADDQQSPLVRLVTDQGAATLHYNPGVLPRLTFAARLFFYTHQCARHGIGDGGKGMSAARARLADCMGLNTLLASDVIKREDVPALQAELSFSEEEWNLLPGPPRAFDLTHCRPTGGGALRMPTTDLPSERQVGWNSCERACADRLWTCQKGCGGECNRCMEAHRECRAGCGTGGKTAD